ncbi:MAG TPA: nickel-responsive transcriptional regulator NikR [Armatimonadetes bacterium]|nr:nickel-responsive transcriptional regulator NikR [Armatimonadota bacterium]
MGYVERFGVSMDAGLLTAFDALIARKGYKNRSEAIRDLIRQALVEEEWAQGDQEVVGAVTLVYEHHARELAALLIEMQHHSKAQVVCSTHVHLDEHNCLEVVVLRGPAKVVRAVADQLIGTRGVKHGRLVTSTTGQRLR